MLTGPMACTRCPRGASDVGETTEISWTDATFNPWWGCERVSDGCQHCYAEAMAKRTGHEIWGKKADRRFFGDSHWHEPVKWNRKAEAAGERRRVFCASMADVFEGRPELVEPRARLFELIDATPSLDWLLLTKRPQNVKPMVADWISDPDDSAHWPSNVWLGTTVEHQAAYEERVPILAGIPAEIRFLSVEPMLGPVDLGLLTNHAGHEHDYVNGFPHRPICLDCSTEDHEVEWFIPVQPYEWVIVGGESGPKHRLFDPAWASSIRDQCARAGVAMWFKQVGGLRPKDGGHMLDGEVIHQLPK